jgi:hypothetical protein
LQGSARPPRCRLRSIRTCCATPAASSLQTMATTRAPCSTTSATRTSNTRYVTPSCHLTGSRISGGDWWLGPAVHQAKQGFASLPDRAENDFSLCATSRASGSAAHRKRQVKGMARPRGSRQAAAWRTNKPRLVTARDRAQRYSRRKGPTKG